ncbi:MAG: hypothetical protein MHPDNHAH_02832 [Anaerolineales bacterium]|nr:hypothetical protein [Anaerolineales bacterium]
MTRNRRKIWSAIIIAIMSGSILSILAMTPYQEAATSTPEPSNTATLTFIPTATLTVTPSPSATPTQTPTDNAFLALQTQNAEIIQKLGTLEQNYASQKNDDTKSFAVNLVSEAFWDFIKWFFSVTGLAAAITKFLRIQAESAGKTPNRTLINLEVLFRDAFKVALWIVIAFTLIWSVYYLGQSIRQSSDSTELVSISNKLDEIQDQINSSSIATPMINPVSAPVGTQSVLSPQNPPAPDQDSENNMFLLLVAEAMGLGIVAFFVYFSSKLTKHQTKIYEANVSNVNFQEIGTSLLPALLIVLMLLLLPSPVDSILMPLLIPFLVYGFFEVIRIYPSLYLKKLVLAHYSKIIYIAQFGAWYSFFSTLKNYASPFFEIYQTVWGRLVFKISAFINGLPSDLLSQLPQIVWDFVPLLFAFGLAVKPWRRIKMQAETTQIMKIKESINQNAVNSKSGE